MTCNIRRLVSKWIQFEMNLVFLHSPWIVSDWNSRAIEIEFISIVNILYWLSWLILYGYGSAWNTTKETLEEFE